MKKIILFLFVITIFVISGCSQNQQNNQNSQQNINQQQEQAKQINKQNCLQDDCLLVDNVDYPVGELPEDIVEAMGLAIEDEYKAKTTYEKIIEKFGKIKPFIMIVRAEETHISSLKAVYDKYGVDIPENNWGDKIIAPETLQEACATGVVAEIENARLYREDLLPLVSEYPDIENVFTNLMNASQQKHLPAFERCD